MTTVPLLVLPISLLHHRQPSSSSSSPLTLPPHSHTHNFPYPIFSNSSNNKKTIVFGINPSDSRPDNPLFLDENNAVVDDMDGYLNNLSLEYESVWDTKPSCSTRALHVTRRVPVSISWNPPPLDLVKLNTDGGVFKGLQQVAQNRGFIVVEICVDSEVVVRCLSRGDVVRVEINP
ncbi:hypothetical protein L195_g016534 [Trifolium pratense]|uniref:Uncharacterized protein n=1 Tax=Trifolium pratense TaxID=57577 RepID=A0A2K3MNQ6_TRIPR|nr:hypothetical protein L195_g031598 [Trifolium pratense]PNX92415.1 hypothetical protein L195_g015551 [Trifolium pratense]PNX93380.1 hypothetical protein L195_g016534 [Trifolium pratense]